MQEVFTVISKNNCDLLIGVFKKDLSISGSVKFNHLNQISNFSEKNEKLKNKTGYCNAGVYLIRKTFLKKFKKDIFLDFGKDVFKKKFLIKIAEFIKLNLVKLLIHPNYIGKI